MIVSFVTGRGRPGEHRSGVPIYGVAYLAVNLNNLNEMKSCRLDTLFFFYLTNSQPYQPYL